MVGVNEHFVRELVGMVEYAVEYGYYASERDLTWSRKAESGPAPDSAYCRARHGRHCGLACSRRRQR
jgi:hypothetical protein